MSLREPALSALFDQLRTMALAPVKRNEAVPAAGLVILRDSEPGEPDAMLNPIHFYDNHRTEIETFVPQPSSGGGEARLDVLPGDIGTALAAERSLGGLAETLTWSAQEISVLEGEGQRLL
jgi:hypothetical protein